jgi:hypothetical protein
MKPIPLEQSCSTSWEEPEGEETLSDLDPDIDQYIASDREV